MIHFLPESAAAELSAPYAEAVARLAGLRHALGIVDPEAARQGALFDEEQLAAGWPGTSGAARRCFDRRSTQATAAAAAGLEALLGARDSGIDANPVARRRIADEIRSGLEDLSRLMRG